MAGGCKLLELLLVTRGENDWTNILSRFTYHEPASDSGVDAEHCCISLQISIYHVEKPYSTKISRPQTPHYWLAVEISKY